MQEMSCRSPKLSSPKEKIKEFSPRNCSPLGGAKSCKTSAVEIKGINNLEEVFQQNLIQPIQLAMENLVLFLSLIPLSTVRFKMQRGVFFFYILHPLFLFKIIPS